jgi:hypothetical protein
MLLSFASYLPNGKYLLFGKSSMIRYAEIKEVYDGQTK